MDLQQVAPLLLVFFAWGIKPGPHTILLIMRGISHGTRSALSIAIGNNFVHVALFIFFSLAVNLLTPNPWSLVALRFFGGIYIVTYCAREVLRASRMTGDLFTTTDYGEHAISGVAVGLGNPLNFSFYAAIVPGLAKYHLSGADIGVLSFLIFFALLAGQSFYIAFADAASGYLSVSNRRKTILIASNIVFAAVGGFIAIRAFMCFFEEFR